MEYHKTITLKDGRACTLRNGTAEDGQALLKIFNLTHTQTDYLLTYPEEHSYTAEDEAELLRRKTDSADEIELLGISVDKAHWGLGIGRALTEGCIECARTAGYVQLELEAVAENKSALALYRSVGFQEYGRNPKGFRSRLTGWQELVLMRLELGGPSAV